MKMPNGIVLYRGPSEIDGKPIICIATGLTTIPQAQDRPLSRLGYRTFRVTLLDSRIDRKSLETICHASAEMGHRTSCALCKACGGLSAKAKTDILITVHGAASKVNAARLNALT